MAAVNDRNERGDGSPPPRKCEISCCAKRRGRGAHQSEAGSTL
jgi:hypothetical protein